MARMKILSRTLRRRLGVVARDRLMQSLDAVCQCPAGAPEIAPDLG